MGNKRVGKAYKIIERLLWSGQVPVLKSSEQTADAEMKGSPCHRIIRKGVESFKFMQQPVLQHDGK